MSKLGRFDKHPGEIENYTIDYSDDLATGDSLATVSVAVDVPSLTIMAYGIEGKAARVWLSGGEVGHSYQITVTVDTVTGRRLQDAFTLRIKEL